MPLKIVCALLFFIGAGTVVVMLNSCSSSTDEPGQFAGANTGSSTNTTGIGGSGCTDSGCVDLAFGDITGFGSVIVNGVVYDTSDAQFSISGMPAEQSDFQVGMNVTAVTADNNSDSQPLAAGSITYAPMVLGPVTTTSLAEGRLDILGQTVVVNASTFLDGVSLNANASDVIAEGAIIEVSGIRNADNNIVATYVRRADSATSYQLQGSIDAEVNASEQLSVDGLLVDVSGIDSVNANVDDVVSLFLTPDAQTTTVLPGSLISPVPTITELLDRFDGSQIRVEGFISDNNLLGLDLDLDLGLELDLDLDLDLTFAFKFAELQVFLTADTKYRFPDGSTASVSDLGANSRIELIAKTTGIEIVTAEEIVIVEP